MCSGQLVFKSFQVDHYHVQLTGVEIYIKITINMGGGGGVGVGGANSYLCKNQ